MAREGKGQRLDPRNGGRFVSTALLVRHLCLAHFPGPCARLLRRNLHSKTWSLATVQIQIRFGSRSHDNATAQPFATGKCLLQSRSQLRNTRSQMQYPRDDSLCPRIPLVQLGQDSVEHGVARVQPFAHIAASAKLDVPVDRIIIVWSLCDLGICSPIGRGDHLWRGLKKKKKNFRMKSYDACRSCDWWHKMHKPRDYVHNFMRRHP